MAARELNRKNGLQLQIVLVHTGQHHDPKLFDVFFHELDLPKPDYNLGVGSGSHAVQTAEVMSRFEPVVERPITTPVGTNVLFGLNPERIVTEGIQVLHAEPKPSVAPLCEIEKHLNALFKF